MKNFEVALRFKIKANYPEHAVQKAIREALDGSFNIIEVKGRSIEEGLLLFYPKELAVCQDCGLVFRIPNDNDFATIPNLNERVAPGEEMPVCECPSDDCCGALCHILAKE
jgi:hypothetical protein